MTLPDERIQILGVAVNAITMQDALDQLAAWVEARSAHYVCVVPAHTIMECVNQPALLPVYNQSGMTTPDGMPVVWLTRRAAHRPVERVYGPDLMEAVCKLSAERGYRQYFYGGAPGVAETLAARLQAKYPGLIVAGIDSPPFRSLTTAEEDAAVERIRAAGADILWVGLGAPRQDVWMKEHLDRLNVPVLVGVGAAFDFLAGKKRQAPRWIQRSGFEWLYRLLQEPGRLWKRYLKNYPRFVFLIGLELLGLRRSGQKPAREQ